MLVDALRSDRFQQNIGSLRSEDGKRHCCLGVATQVALDAGLVVDESNRDHAAEPWNQGYQVMCQAVHKWYGFNTGNPYLAGMVDGKLKPPTAASLWNDELNANFDEIADAFEATYITETTPLHGAPSSTV